MPYEPMNGTNSYTAVSRIVVVSGIKAVSSFCDHRACIIPGTWYLVHTWYLSRHEESARALLMIGVPAGCRREELERTHTHTTNSNSAANNYSPAVQSRKGCVVNGRKTKGKEQTSTHPPHSPPAEPYGKNGGSEGMRSVTYAPIKKIGQAALNLLRCW